MPGKTLLVAIFTLLSLGVAVTAEPVMPIRPEQAELIIPVGSGCGIGVHRGPFDGCNVIYGGYYSAYAHGYYHGYRDGFRDGYYTGVIGPLMVDQGACSGRRMYRVCDIYGTCWANCI